MQRPLRVALRHSELVVAGLTAMLAPYVDRVQVRSTGDRVDVVLCDAAALAPDTPRSLDDLRRAWRTERIVVVDWCRAAAGIERVLADGADGYLGMRATTREVVGLLEYVAAGEVVVAGADSSNVRLTTNGWLGRTSGLSRRESEIVALVSQGLSNQEIAERVHLSINTVKVHVRRAYRTMGVRSRTQAVLWAVDLGFNSGAGATERAARPVASA